MGCYLSFYHYLREKVGSGPFIAGFKPAPENETIKWLGCDDFEVTETRNFEYEKSDVFFYYY